MRDLAWLRDCASSGLAVSKNSNMDSASARVDLARWLERRNSNPEDPELDPLVSTHDAHGIDDHHFPVGTGLCWNSSSGQTRQTRGQLVWADTWTVSLGRHVRHVDS